MKALALAMTLGLLSSAVQAATIYVDISGANAPMPDSMGRYWNATPLNPPAAPAYILIDAVDSTNAPTPVALNLLAPFTGSIQTGFSGSTLTDWDDEVTGDNWYVASGTTAQVRVEGLVPSNNYDLLFYGKRGTDTNRLTQITINSIDQIYDATVEGLVTFADVAADASGEILFAVSTAGSFGHLSAIQITGNFTPPIIPEPSTLALILLGMIPVIGNVRRRRARSA